MAITSWRVGFTSQTTMSMWVRSDDDGSYFLTVAGQGGTIDTGLVGDGTAMVEATDLTPGTPYDLKIGGTIVATVNTLPADGEPARIMSTNCCQIPNNFPFGKIVEDRAPDMFMWNGDNGYSHHTLTDKYEDDDGNLVSMVPCSLAPTSGPVTTVQKWCDFMRMFLSCPGVKRVNHQFPNTMILSNHDRGSSIDDHSKGGASDDGDMDTQQLANDSYENAMTAVNAYRPDPPYAVHGEPDDRDLPEGIDSESATYTTAIYDPRWYKFMCGCIEVFVIDTISGKTLNARTDDADAYMIGEHQEDWLIREVNGSEAVWKMIVSAHAIHASIEPEGNWVNGWHTRQTQLKRIVDAFEVTGVFWNGANWHAPSVQIGGINGQSSFAASNLGPGGQAHNITSPPHMHPQADLNYGGYMQDSFINQSCVGQIDATSSQLTVTAVNSQGQNRIVATMNPDSNEFASIDLIDIVPPFSYTHQFSATDYLRCGYGDGSSGSATWRADQEYASISGWMYGMQLIGFSVQPKLPSMPVRSAELCFWLEADPPADLVIDPRSRRFDIFFVEPGDADGHDLIPWGDSPNSPIDNDAKWQLHTIDPAPGSTVQSATDLDPGAPEPGWCRLDITEYINDIITHGSYDPAGTWVNIGLTFNSTVMDGYDRWYMSSPDSAGADIYAPRINIQQIDTD